MTPDDSGALRPAFLVFAEDPFVAEDIARTVAETRPGARVEVAVTPDALETLLPSLGLLELAFVQIAPATLPLSRAGEALRLSGARLVLLGFEAEQEGEAAGYAVLHRPFTMADVISHLDAPALR